MLSILKFILHVGQIFSDSNLDIIKQERQVRFCKTGKKNICSHTLIVTGLLRTSAQTPHLHNVISVFVFSSRSTSEIWMDRNE